MDDLPQPAKTPLNQSRWRACIALIGENNLKKRHFAYQPFQHMRRFLPVGLMRRMHQDCQQQSQRIGDDVALASLDEFAAVEASCPADVGGFDRLAVDDGCAGAGVSACLESHTAAQGIGELFEQASLGPLSKVIVDGLPRGKALGKHAPLAAGFVEVKQGVTDASGLVFSERLPLEERFDSFPLGVRQVGAIVARKLHGSGVFCEGERSQNTGGRYFV